MRFEKSSLYKNVLVPKKELQELEKKINKAIKTRNKEDYKTLIKIYNIKKDSLRDTLEKGVDIETWSLYQKLLRKSKEN